MSNVFLEKIAFSAKDTRDARESGLKAGRKVEAKGTKVGAAIGAPLGAGLGLYSARKIERAHLLPKQPALRAAMAVGMGALGALSGAGLGSAAVADHAQKTKLKEHTRKVNASLEKSAAVTQRQVEHRSARNDALAGLGGLGGMVAGGVGGTAAVGIGGIHKGLKESGGYTSAKNTAKNAYIRRKTEKTLGKGVTLAGKENSVALYGGSRKTIARETGDVLSRVMKKRGLIGALAGAAIGGTVASKAVTKRTDASDVNHYLKLSKKNQGHG